MIVYIETNLYFEFKIYLYSPISVITLIMELRDSRSFMGELKAGRLAWRKSFERKTRRTSNSIFIMIYTDKTEASLLGYSRR